MVPAKRWTDSRQINIKLTYMRTLKCKLRFPGNEIVTAEAASRAPGALVPVLYSGPSDQLGATLCNEGDLGYVEWYLRGRARYMQATIEVVVQGEYDELWTNNPETEQHKELTRQHSQSAMTRLMF
jgi:hypothetical protein